MNHCGKEVGNGNRKLKLGGKRMSANQVGEQNNEKNITMSQKRTLNQQQVQKGNKYQEFSLLGEKHHRYFRGPIDSGKLTRILEYGKLSEIESKEFDTQSLPYFIQ